jgi:hypothetical protein
LPLPEACRRAVPEFVRETSRRFAPVSLPGYLPALLRKRVPVRATAWVDGVLVGEPEPDDEGRNTLTLTSTFRGGRVPLKMAK